MILTNQVNNVFILMIIFVFASMSLVYSTNVLLYCLCAFAFVSSGFYRKVLIYQAQNTTLQQGMC